MCGRSDDMLDEVRLDWRVGRCGSRQPRSVIPMTSSVARWREVPVRGVPLNDRRTPSRDAPIPAGPQAHVDYHPTQSPSRRSTRNGSGERGLSGVTVGRRSAGTVTANRDAAHHTSMAAIVVERVVLDAAVVPHGDRSGLPPEAARALLCGRVREQESQQRRRLGAMHALDADRERRVHIQALTPRLGCVRTTGCSTRLAAASAAPRVAIAELCVE